MRLMNELKNTNTLNTKKEKTFGGENPIIHKFAGVEERASGQESKASYLGITVKTLFFLLVTAVGFGLYYIIAPYLAIGEPIVLEQFEIYIPQAALALGVVIFTIVMPLLACFISSTIPVTGSLYSLSQGMLISWISYTFAGRYNDVIILSVFITLVLVFSMLLLYTTGTVKPNKKFRTVVTTLFATFVITSIAFGIAYFIPALRGFVDLIVGNFVISIAFSVVGIIIACMFLLCDFDTIQQTVEKGLPKKYEWLASFGLAFTIIWLYLKVLDILMRLKDNS
ncbi:MAG: Bax inhibitor-1/YccA family protein [Ruminococcus sp.]